MTNRRQKLAVSISRTTLLLVVIVASSQMDVAADADQRPNIVLCMADDQGWGDVGYYGKSIAITPVLDEMAASALRLDRFYAAAPVCSPTRGSVLTGRHPNRFACFSWGHSLRPEEITIAEVLAAAGYATGHFGKWHLGSVNSNSDVCPGASGFDQWFSSPNFYENDPLMSHNGRVVQTKGEGSEVTMKAAIDFIRASSQEKKPFFAVVWFGSPHNPHVALDADRQLYADQPAKLQHYYGEITAMDRSIGTLRKELRKLDIAGNTLVWYTSDNGPQGPLSRKQPGSAGGLRDRKGTLWEGGIRVPTIIEWPTRISAPRISSVPGNTVDIFPTLLDIAGIDAVNQPQPIDGLSILPLIDGKMTDRAKPMGFWSFPARGQGMASRKMLAAQLAAQRSGEPLPPPPNNASQRKVRADAALEVLAKPGLVGHAAWIDNQYKLHRIPTSDPSSAKYTLYNLAVDTAEANDLARKMPDRVARMRADLNRWQQSVVRSIAGDDYLSQRSSP
ncbi:MAG TPA: sulfatase-like hydrolase/transferase [Pirellulaceae bacterium]|nr:sulfatase-like hydrolase/transferase [Pirellulaceae bacterium]